MVLNELCSYINKNTFLKTLVIRKCIMREDEFIDIFCPCIMKAEYLKTFEFCHEDAY